MASRTLHLRRADTCAACGVGLNAGEKAWWNAKARTVRCLPCHSATGDRTPNDAPTHVDRGTAGASAGREYQRRKTNRETRVRQAHPRLGGLLLWLTDAPQHEQAFHTGHRGEAAVGASLEQRTAEGPAIILHDRRMPRRAGNIDHIAIAPAGVFVIDAKAHSGRVAVERPLFGSPKLRVNGRNRTKLVDGLDRQVAAVRAVLERVDHADIPVQGVLCFTDADLPLLRTLTIRGHLLLYRKALARRLNATGPLQAAQIDQLARRLATEFPPA